MLMTSTLPILGEYDYRRLRLLLRALRQSETRDRGSIKTLQSKLERAIVVPPSEVPADVVTIYSTVRFRNLNAKDERALTMVFPGETRDREDCVSVLAPVGLALLGERQGSTVACATPKGPVRLRVTELLFQPESTGAYYV